MTSRTIDYSVWDHIEVSDDEDETHPNIDTPSLFRWRHQARVEKQVAFEEKGEELERNMAECKRRLEEVQYRVKELEEEGKKEGEEERKTALSKAQAEEKKYRKDQRLWEKKMEEHRREEKKMPWNVDTLSKEGFSKSILNIKPEVTEETEEQKEEKHQTFVDKHKKEIKHFGMLRRWEDSQKYLSDHPYLVCEETANFLVIMCIDLEVDEKHGLMDQVAHQTIVMQFILELAKSLKIDPRGCFREFFQKIKTADQPYQEAFTDELESFKERVRGRAKIRIQKAMEEYEEEERQNRLGPGGLDPVEVYDTLPEEMKKCFDDKDISMLQEAISKMDPMEAKGHMKRCIDSGLWVPNANTDNEEDKEEDEEEDKEDEEEAEKEGEAEEEK
uniref:hsp90 co-chaperone Cdc37-like n=2 Tax=Oncorhynchus gorbuscha TaxID=8017 RepID=UPI001EAECDF2|nr:hsp90 co-chaperone Cdc37-like [Oncorhynchus gorbuscha]XP_046203460.1 hsp90 co-chaperone Cdc37-like [Oncorhynchus gorbuscha]XP_046209419.1 hsp90 co-chaperone Cdc37-like [Oncorhynchus gorbuscha]XP_046223578.1 hsp90 co-chaperone Cdc37-like [Oncorhynchus gorbuscha]